MQYLNLGCGGNRPAGRMWINIDNLHAVFTDLSTPERRDMDSEPNYLNHDISEGIPFPDDSVDGILMSHVLEHFDLQGGMRLLKDCRRVLKPEGVLRISVPCPRRFYKLTMEGCTDWGEKNPHSDMSFMEWALFFHEHRQLVSLDSLKCMLHVAGFAQYEEKEFKKSWAPGLEALDNRKLFSLFMEARK